MSDEKANLFEEVNKAEVQSYGAYLKDKYRPPSKGGNTTAWHQHVIKIDGEFYSFLARGAGKFVHKGEAVSFEWEWDATGNYRNIRRDSVVAWNKSGEPVARGNRTDKPWRSVDTRLPARRSEWKD